MKPVVWFGMYLVLSVWLTANALRFYDTGRGIFDTVLAAFMFYCAIREWRKPW